MGYIGQAIIGAKVPNGSHVASIHHRRVVIFKKFCYLGHPNSWAMFSSHLFSSTRLFRLHFSRPQSKLQQPHQAPLIPLILFTSCSPSPCRAASKVENILVAWNFSALLLKSSCNTSELRLIHQIESNPSHIELRSLMIRYIIFVTRQNFAKQQASKVNQRYIHKTAIQTGWVLVVIKLCLIIGSRVSLKKVWHFRWDHPKNF